MVPAAAALVVFVVHLLANPHYGFFRDELYFIICGRHPQFGYVDQPPVIPLLAAGSQLLGHSLLLLRAIPAAFAAGGVYVTCLLVEEFGGRTFAQILAAMVFFFTGVLMSFGMKVSPDSVGLFTWPLIALLIVRIVNGADPRLWIAVGAALGISIESKYSVVFFAGALTVGLLLTPQRRTLATWWAAGGAALATLVALPNFLWQWRYGFPMLELLQNGQHGKNIILGPALYMAQEILITGLLLAIVWIIGLVWLFVTPRWRFLAYAYVVLIGEMVLLHGKHYYPANVYPILIAAGALPLEHWTRVRPWARWATVAAIAMIGAIGIPMALPVLSEPAYVSYSAAMSRVLHLPSNASATEAHRDDGPLPADWADMHGWPELAATVAGMYRSLPVQERRQAVVFAGNYGEASAINFFQPQIPVISEHNQYWIWGTHGFTGNVLIQVGGSCFNGQHLFASRVRARTISDPWAIAYENDLPIWICRNIRQPLALVWPSIKSYE